MNEAHEVKQFAQELTALQRKLYVYIITRVSHPVDAEDILQEVNRVMWEKLDEFQPGSSFAAWAYRIAYFEVLTFRKRKVREASRFRDGTLELLARDAVRMIEEEDAQREVIRQCLAKLKESDRELITRRYLAESGMRDLAVRYCRSEKSLYRSLARIRTLLLECIRRTLALESLS